MRVSSFFERINECNDDIRNIFDNVSDEVYNLPNIFDVMHEYCDGREMIIHESSKVDSTAIVKGKVFIGENTVISPYAVIEGPVVIGKNVTIGTHVHIRPYSFIGDNVSIEHCSETKNSIIMNNSKIAVNTFVGDSILGYGARVGSGTITSNRRFDQKNITYKIDNEKVDTGRDFLGVVLGDYARLGANCTTLPGTLIGKFSLVFPGLTVSGTIDDEKLVKPKERNYEIVCHERTILKG